MRSLNDRPPCRAIASGGEAARSKIIGPAPSKGKRTSRCPLSAAEAGIPRFAEADGPETSRPEALLPDDRAYPKTWKLAPPPHLRGADGKVQFVVLPLHQRSTRTARRFWTNREFKSVQAGTRLITAASSSTRTNCMMASWTCAPHDSGSRVRGLRVFPLVVHPQPVRRIGAYFRFEAPRV